MAFANGKAGKDKPEIAARGSGNGMMLIKKRDNEEILM